MITEMKIHPALGIARVGNSPDEWYIGPETADMPPIPPDGYKDAECRIKRQAARFRLFAYHDDGPPTEITAADGAITWTVEVANLKALPSGGATSADVSIAPGPKSVGGPNAREVLSGGSISFTGAPVVGVELGEIRTDHDGHLIVLGGLGVSASPGGHPLRDDSDSSPGWYDDVSDGSINATVTIDGTTIIAEGAWVVVAPPNFAPTVRPAKSLYDDLYDTHRRDGLFGIGHHDPVSFRRHIHPILETAVLHGDVHSGIGSSHGNLVESLYPIPPARRAEIVDRLDREPDTMPPTYIGKLYETQLEALRRWRDDHPSYIDDWAIPPVPLELTPDELDRGALWHAIAGPTSPGLDVGQSFFELASWTDPFRVDQSSMSPGYATMSLAVPWQADFAACSQDWWPSHRPGQTIEEATRMVHEWSAGAGSISEMVDRWHTLGFVVPQGGELVEVERCDVASITLLTPVLDFVDVPQGPGGVSVSRSLPIHFEVMSQGGVATFRIVTGATTPPFSRMTVTDVEVGPTTGAPTDARLWVRYATEAVGPSAPDTVVVRHDESGREWTVELRANTAPRRATAVALVLDRSGSMRESRGDGATKLSSLQEAASLFVDLAHAGDGIGAVQYNGDVQDEHTVMPLGSAVDPFDPARSAIKSFIGGLSASGGTSIGDGIERGRQLLDMAGSFERRAMIVITDGKETSPKWISDVAGTIDSTTYAVGIGTAGNVDAATLQALAGNHGGYLLVTGPIVGDKQFVLMKYFLQILAGISGADVLLDPDGEIRFGDEIRIPFSVSDADQMLDVVLLSPAHPVIDLRVQTPLGTVLTPSSSEVEHVPTTSGAMFRFRLPVMRSPGRPAQAGTWTAILSVPERPNDVDCDQRRGEWRQHASERGTAAYSVMVNVYSDISMHATLRQETSLPGSPVEIVATVSSSGAPFDGEGGAFAEVDGPSGDRFRIDMDVDRDGRFVGSFTASDPGVHRARIRFVGQTAAGWRFDREQTRTAVVAIPAPASATPRETARDRRWCSAVSCCAKAFDSRRFRAFAKFFGIDAAAARTCLERWCRTTAPDEAT